MNLDLVREIGSSNNWLAVISIARPDGSIHSSLVNAGVMDHPTGGEPVVAMVVGHSARKLDYLRKAGRATLTFQHGWQWAAVEGDVEVIGPDDPGVVPPAGLPGLMRDVFRSAGGTHDDWDEYDRVIAGDRRAAVLISPARVVTNPG